MRMCEGVDFSLPTENPAGDVVLKRVLVPCGSENTRRFFFTVFREHVAAG